MTILDAGLAALAEFHGVHTSYADVGGVPHSPDDDVVLSLLRALGVPVDRVDDAVSVLHEQRLATARRRLEPVVVHRIGRTDPITARLPEGTDPAELWVTLDLEDGTTTRERLSTGVTGFVAAQQVNGVCSAQVQLDLQSLAGGPVPIGRHRLSLEGAGPPEDALLLVAPDCPPARRQWGAFLPLHAVRSEFDWGIGTYGDLALLGESLAPRGAGLLGTLPLYPPFPGTPMDPSPYLPLSRLAYNELYVDPVALPEFAASEDARSLAGSAAFVETLAALRSAPLVDYDEVARMKRRVLEAMARTVRELPERGRALRDFGRRHPELEQYARFRAGLDRPGTVGEPDPNLVGYHLYCQWAAFEQLTAATGPVGRYADFPIGSHPRGFDPEWSPVSFVPGVHGGAPPDHFFASGQDWGFHPLHPQRIREDGYRFVSAALARAFRHADCVRIDHVMGLQRLFMIPDGCGGHGAYVSYRADELHALVALEAHRAGSVVVGEDLGTVPAGVRRRMARDRMLRTWVFQFESTPEVPLPSPPANCLATLSTHDLPRFGAYLWGDDIAARERLGALTPDQSADELAARAEWRGRLLRVLGTSSEGASEAAVTAAALRGCLAHLARSDAAIVLVDLEELWDERQPQNVPGTGPEAGNWRRRSARTIEEISHDPSVGDVLATVERERAS